MTIALRIDATDPTPPYEQLRRQFAAPIASGALAAGTRLPTVRQLASDLGIAPGTVMRAYAELEEQGLIIKRRGGGSIVAEGTSDPAAAAPALRQLADEFVAKARNLGATDAQIVDAVQQRAR